MSSKNPSAGLAACECVIDQEDSRCGALGIAALAGQRGMWPMLLSRCKNGGVAVLVVLILGAANKSLRSISSRKGIQWSSWLTIERRSLGCGLHASALGLTPL